MLPSPDLLVPSGPPPQAVLDQRPWWRLLYAILTTTCLLRLVGLDVAGALLSGVMLCFAILMTRDGMVEMSRYALIYGILSLMNLVFDVLPLIYAFSGRASSEVQSVKVDENNQESYTVITENHPFFDATQGIPYNAESIGMILSPLAMLIGAYLAITAHNEIQRLGMSYGMGYGDDNRWELPGAGAGAGFREATGTPGGAPQPYGATSGQGQPRGPPFTFQRFAGTAHKLDA
mmetsp:Transcript_63129/g.137215  ORF Transcript_63129/g.137215 Transcript_63129/m.137215 type:complete len:233 (+) Transcript_63129:257-955(+)